MAVIEVNGKTYKVTRGTKKVIAAHANSTCHKSWIELKRVLLTASTRNRRSKEKDPRGSRPGVRRISSRYKLAPT